MRDSTILSGAAGVLLAVLGASAGAETVTFTGSATYTAQRELLPLSNGGAAVHVTNRVIGTLSPSDSSGFITGDCAGLAYISPEGDVSIDNLCTFMENDEDGFTLRGRSGVEGGKSEIIGGTGRFEGATGQGRMRRTWLEGNRGSVEYEFRMELN